MSQGINSSPEGDPTITRPLTFTEAISSLVEPDQAQCNHIYLASSVAVKVGDSKDSLSFGGLDINDMMINEGNCSF